MQSGNYGNYGGPFGQFLGGIFGNSGEPYQKGMNAYQPWMQQGINAQNPFFQAGKGAIPGYQNWVNSMQNPQDFINNMMKGYQQSPWAKYEAQQANRAGINAASAGGLAGSTPFAQQMQQNAANISSQDMQNWMGNVLGANSMYGQGLGNEVGWGQGAANQMGNMYGNLANTAYGSAYGQQAGQNQDWGNIFGGLAGMFF
jgi:hypothetical protein